MFKNFLYRKEGKAKTPVRLEKYNIFKLSF